MIARCAVDNLIIAKPGDAYDEAAIFAIDEFDGILKTLFIIILAGSHLSEIFFESYVWDGENATIEPLPGDNFHAFWSGC